MMKILLGFVLCLICIAAAGFLYFRMGWAPVATSAPAMPFEKRLAGLALHAAMAKQPMAQAPIPADETNLSAGARVYREQCAVCHGLPDQPETAIAHGMFPSPPQLFRGHGVTDDPPGETYWKAANGIRLTGMPGFKGSLNDTQLWQVSLLLANADKIPPSAKAALVETQASK